MPKICCYKIVVSVYEPEEGAGFPQEKLDELFANVADLAHGLYGEFHPHIFGTSGAVNSECRCAEIRAEAATLDVAAEIARLSDG